jgi:hypothetical protein
MHISPRACTCSFHTLLHLLVWSWTQALQLVLLFR